MINTDTNTNQLNYSEKQNMIDLDKENEDANQWLTDAFAQHLCDWENQYRQNNHRPILTNDEKDFLMTIAKTLSLETSIGASCINCSDNVERLKNYYVVKQHTDNTIRPLILDNAGRLYLERYFQYEQNIARKLTQLKSNKTLKSQLITDIIARVCDDKSNLSHEQKLAVLLSLTQSYVIISGGPGTGKTRTTAKIIEALLLNNPEHRIALAAPTGKAAKKLESSIHANLSESLKPFIHLGAQTVHRLLGKTPENIIYHEKNLLPYDTIIIDESSMLDLEVANDLFQALSNESQIILLGDKDQLESVDVGTLFVELSSDVLYNFNDNFIQQYPSLFKEIQTPKDNNTFCSNHAIRFTKNFRQAANSVITKLAECINKKDIKQLNEILNTPSDALSCKENITNLKHLNLADQYQPYFECLKANPDDKESIFASFEQFRILCATNIGSFGIHKINDLITKQLINATQDLQQQAKKTFNDTLDLPIGTPVMVTENDYGTGLSNGDIGIILFNPKSNNKGKREKRIVFLDSDKTFLLHELRDYQIAFAMTIHKSQGSEFKNVAIVITQSKVLSKQLLYTGVTRAKESLTILTTQSIDNLNNIKDEKRESGLIDRLKEASSALPISK